MASVESVAVVAAVAGKDLGVKYKHHKVGYILHKWGCCKHYKHWRTSEDVHSHYRDPLDCATDPWEGPLELECQNMDCTSQAEVVPVVDAVVLPTVPFCQVVEASRATHLAHVGEQKVLAVAGPMSFFGVMSQAEKCKKVEDPLDWVLVNQAAVLAVAEVAALVIVVVVT